MENEFDILNRRMEKNLEMRHTYLMFAFTTAFVSIAALLAANIENISSWIFVVPFSVIIPFQARVSYSRLNHAKMEAYVIVFYPKKFSFLEIPLNELSGIMGKVLAIISNYELTLLSIAVDILFIVIKKKILDMNKIIGIDAVIMIICTLIVFICATYTFPYLKFLNKYIEKYKGIKAN